MLIRLQKNAAVVVVSHLIDFLFLFAVFASLREKISRKAAETAKKNKERFTVQIRHHP